MRNSNTYCPDASGDRKGEAFDVRATRDGVAVYSTAVNGESFPYQRRAGESKIRVDGMGPGDDFWVMTRQELQLHIFFVDDVAGVVLPWRVTK